MNNLEDQLWGIVKEEFQLDQFNSTDKFIKDLNRDSIDIAGLMLRLNKEFPNTNLTIEDFLKDINFNDLYDLMECKLGLKSNKSDKVKYWCHFKIVGNSALNSLSADVAFIYECNEEFKSDDITKAAKIALDAYKNSQMVDNLDHYELNAILTFFGKLKD